MCSYLVGNAVLFDGLHGRQYGAKVLSPTSYIDDETDGHFNFVNPDCNIHRSIRTPTKLSAIPPFMDIGSTNYQHSVQPEGNGWIEVRVARWIYSDAAADEIGACLDGWRQVVLSTKSRIGWIHSSLLTRIHACMPSVPGDPLQRPDRLALRIKIGVL